MNDRPARMLSIIVPTLNEELSIGALLDAVAGLRGPLEVIVADGGSTDRTISIAGERGAQIVLAERGRGSQMRAGAAQARGDVLWFLHADTLPPTDAAERIAAALRDPEVVGGSFEVRFSGSGAAARLFTRAYRLVRCLGVCYGDGAIFVRRSMYEQIGGFRPLPIFEDLDLVQRLARSGRLVCVPSPVETSSRRFERRSAAAVLFQWIGLHLLYWLGVSPRTLARLYAPVRGSQRVYREGPP